MDHIYKGVHDRQNGTRFVEKDGIEFPAELSLKIRRHSPTGFAWGYGGSGPAQLALALLLEVVPVEVAETWYQSFKFRVVAALGDEWEMTSVDILEALREVQNALEKSAGIAKP